MQTPTRPQNGAGIDTGLANAVKLKLSSDQWAKIVDRAILQAEAGDSSARDFLHTASIMCW